MTELDPTALTGASRDYPLSGITVLDLSHVYNGPYATLLMALAGATVIKIEPLDGEHLRNRGDIGGASLPFAMLNSNKHAVTINLKSPEGAQVFRDMSARADVVVENFRPGVMDKLGVGARTLMEANPRLVYGSSSGYGKDGPYRDYPAMDLVMQAMCGVMSVTGFPDEPPVKAGAALCDFSAGIHLYAAIMTALYERERTGRGRVVDVAMQDAIYSSMASNLGILHSMGERAPNRTGNHHGGLGIAPYNVYHTADGYIAVNAPGDVHFRSILSVIGREDLAEDARFNTRGARVANMAQVDELIEAWTSTVPRDEASQLLLSAGVPCAPVRELSEVVTDRNMHERGSLQWIEHPELGHVVVPHSPLKFDDLPLLPLQPSHALGADNEAIYVDWLGYERSAVVELKQKGAI